MKIEIKPKHGVLIALFVFLFAYSLYQARFLILGPQIWITSPKNGQTIENPVVNIEGRAKNVAWISLNERQIFTDEEGNWEEKMIVSSGTSIMTIKARDRFGHEIQKNIHIFLK